MSEVKVRLDAFFAEQREADEDAKQRLAERRAEGRTFIEQIALPAFQAIQAALAEHGRRAEVAYAVDPIDTAHVNVVVWDRDEREFEYGVQLDIVPRDVGIDRKSSVFDRETGDLTGDLGSGPPRSSLFGGRKVTDIPQRELEDDFLALYFARMKALRR